MNKSWWKIMMYSDPKWYGIGRIWGTKESNEAADEYESEIGPAAIFILVLFVIGLAAFGLLKLLGVI